MNTKRLNEKQFTGKKFFPARYLTLAAGLTAFGILTAGCGMEQEEDIPVVNVTETEAGKDGEPAENADKPEDRAVSDGVDEEKDGAESDSADAEKDGAVTDSADDKNDAAAPDDAKQSDASDEKDTSEGAAQPETDTGQGGGSQNDSAKLINPDDYEEYFGGKVDSIGENSMVIRKTAVKEGSGGGDAIVLLTDENAELVTVNCTEETKYQRWTIRGGDIDMKDGSFDDIKVGTGMELAGYFDGDIFIAQQVIIEVYE